MKQIITHTASLMLFILFVYAGFGQANTSLSNLSSPTAANQHLQPDANNKRNLGSASKSWRILYLDSAIYLKDSLFIHRRGTNNTFVGENAGKATASASSNTAVGYNALFNDGSGGYNAAMGSYALYSNTMGTQNSAFGHRALYFNKTGVYNIAFGAYTLYNNITGGSNIAIGVNALYKHKKANDNIAIGSETLINDTSGFDNIAAGRASLYSISNGYQNTAVGSSSLFNMVSGYNNCAFGYHAGYYHKGSNNTFLGAYANPGADITNSAAIGFGATVTASNQVRIGNSSVTNIGGQNGWFTISDARVKKNIKDDVPGLLFINKLKPVTYNLSLDAFDDITKPQPFKDAKGNVIAPTNEDVEARKAKEKIVYTGLLAQDVEKVAKETGYNFSGVDAAKNDQDVYSICYSDFVMPLIKAVQEIGNNTKAPLYCFFSISGIPII